MKKDKDKKKIEVLNPGDNPVEIIQDFYDKISKKEKEKLNNAKPEKS